MGEARPGEAEVIQHAIQLLPGDGHAERPHVGEVGQTLPGGLVLLAEDHILLGAVLGAPDADPPLQGSPHALAQLRIDLETTFRCSDRIAAVATDFVLRSPAQIRKTVRSTQVVSQDVV